MALPALEGEIRLTDNTAAALKSAAGNAASADQALTRLQGTAQTTGEALGQIGQGVGGNLAPQLGAVDAQLGTLRTDSEATATALAQLGTASTGNLSAQLTTANGQLGTLAQTATATETRLTSIGQAGSLKNFVSAVAPAEAELGKLQAEAQTTDQSLSNIGRSGALRGFVSAVAPAESALESVQTEAAATNAALSGIGQNASVSGLTSQLGALAAEEELTTAEAQQLQAAFAALNQAQGLTPLVSALTNADQAAQQLNQTLSSASTATGSEQRVAEIQTEAQQRKALIAQLSDATGVSERRITAIVDSESRRRAGDTAEEVAQRKALISQLAAASGATEKQITAQIEAEIGKRTQAQSGGGVNVGGLLAQGAAAAGIALSVRAIASEAVELDQLGVKTERVSQAFTVLSGGADNARARLEAVQRATGGAVDKLSAMEAANKAAALGLGKNADELERVTRLLTTANRAQGLGEDIGASLEKFSGTVSSQSARGLKQLGIDSSEVKARVEQLKFTMAGATDEERFLQAALEVGEKTFAGFGDGAVTSASGLEILGAQLKDLKTQLATGLGTDEVLRSLTVLGGNTDLTNLRRTAEEAAAGLRDSFGPDLFGQQEANAKKFDLLATALKSVGEAQRAGLPGATEYAAQVSAVAVTSEKFGFVTDANVSVLQKLITQYGEGTNAATAFQAVQGRSIENTVVDQLQQKLDALKASQGGVVGGLLDKVLGKANVAEIDNLESVVNEAKARIARGEPIVLDARIKPVVESQLGADVANSLPSAKLFTDLAAAEAEAKNQADLLAVSQQALAAGVTTAAQLAQVQSNKDLADSDVQIIQAKQQVAAANIAYAASLNSTDAAVKQSAQSDKDAADKALSVATARRSAVDAAGQLASAQAQLAAAQASGNGEDAALLQTTIALAQANKNAADSALQLATGQSAVDAAATESADAWKAYEAAIRDIQSSAIGMIDAQTGLPVAFNSATTSGAALLTVLQQLAAAERNLAASAASSSFALGASLAPQLGVAGALQQGNQFRQQAAEIVGDFNSINTAREQAGQAPFGNEVLQASLSNLNAYQQAYVSDMQNAGAAAEKAGERQEKAFEKANKAVSSALDSIISGVIKPTTAGLIEGNPAFAKGKDQFGNTVETAGSIELTKLLPREDAIDEPARQLATVAVEGFKSEYYQHFKDVNIIPPDVIAKGEFAIRQFAAQKVRLNTEGLDADLLNIDTATNKVLEKIKGKQNIDAFIGNVEQRVKGLAPDVGITDIKKALGIDTTAEEIGGAVSTGIKSALAGTLNFDQIRAQLNQALTGTGATGKSPLTDGLTIKEADKATIVASGKTATTETGEAAVAQMDAGKYGERMVATITAQVAAKKADAEKAGKDLADWLGGSLLTNFKDKVPSGLLSILTDKLVPLIQAAQAAQNERTVGAGVAP